MAEFMDLSYPNFLALCGCAESDIHRLSCLMRVKMDLMIRLLTANDDKYALLHEARDYFIGKADALKSQDFDKVSGYIDSIFYNLDPNSLNQDYFNTDSEYKRITKNFPIATLAKNLDETNVISRKRGINWNDDIVKSPDICKSKSVKN